MSPLRVVLTVAALAATTAAAAQVVTGGAGYGYPVAPVVVVPMYPYSYGAYPYGGYLYPDPLRFGDELPSCYRFGRCSLRDLELFRDRPHRLDRLAPAAPDGAPRVQAEPRRADVAPTPVENIRPEYRGASVPREQFRESGKPR